MPSVNWPRTKAGAALLTLVLLVLTTALPLRAADEADPHDLPVKVVADQRIAVVTPAGRGVDPLYASVPLDRPNPTIVRALIVVHGALRNADVYNKSGETVIAAAGPAAAGTALITPQFLADVDVAGWKLPADTLRWTTTSWEGGEPALGPAPLSSFAVFDAIVAKLANRANFPNLRTIVVAGHSGGGQIVQRYAVVGHAEDALGATTGIAIRYVVANPSSYVYFSPERPLAAGGFGPFDAASCPKYDAWKYGVNAMPPYVPASPVALETAYIARDVTYMLGRNDTNPNHPALDKSCMAEAQGPYRLIRGRSYYAYLRMRHPSGLMHKLVEVPGVGHDGDGMFGSPQGRAVLFGVTPN